MDELVDVVVKVPRSKIGTLYEFVGRLVTGEEVYKIKPDYVDDARTGSGQRDSSQAGLKVPMRNVSPTPDGTTDW